MSYPIVLTSSIETLKKLFPIVLPYAFPLNEYGNFWTSDSAGTFGVFISFCRNRSTRRKLFGHTGKKRLYKSDILTYILSFAQNLNAKKKKTMSRIYRIAGACRTRRFFHCKRVVHILVADYRISVFFFFFMRLAEISSRGVVCTRVI